MDPFAFSFFFFFLHICNFFLIVHICNLNSYLWQARAYAKVLNATLFFSSATYNINVNKIFKFITAKLFDLPWTLERNLTIGEPIIDF
jgi:Rab family protein